MNLFTAVWSMVGAVCITLAVMHALIWVLLRRSASYILASFTALAAAGNAFSELFVSQANTIETYVIAMKWEVFFAGLLLVSLTWFVHAYFGTTRKWLAVASSASWAFLLVINYFSPFSLVYHEITEFHTHALPWGIRYVNASGTSNPWNLLANLSPLIILAYIIDGLAQVWKTEAWRRSLPLAGAIVFFLLAAGSHTALVDHNIISTPYLVSFSYLAIVLALSYEIARDVASASRLAGEVAENERRWRTLLDGVKLLVLGLDSAGTVRYVNPYVLALTGFDREEIVGKNWFGQFLPETKKAQFEVVFKKAIEKGELISHNTNSFPDKSGKPLLIHWSNVLIRDPDGEATGCLSIGEDITDRERALRELANEKERMDTILSSLNTGLALINEDMTVDWVNAETQKILPWDALVGKVCYQAAAKRDEPCEDCGALQAFSDGQIHETERQSPVDGKWHHIVSLPIKDEAGRVVKVLEATTDISEQKLTEEARDQAIKELEALKSRLEEENIYLKDEIRETRFFSKLVGKSNALLYVLTRVNEVAETDATVLIQGETGVGKELVARAVHEASRRAEKPFIKVNCAAMPKNLVESELFGHERGSFTGAERQRRGRFEMADGGTLFLDEIGELPLDVQAKLLRVLQDGEFERVGGTKTLKADVRVVAATNHNLGEEVAARRFRADLYYRLNVYPLTVPPLRKRKEDIPLLVEHFVPHIAVGIGKHIDQIPVRIMDRLTAYDWPGNVRELRNVLERAVITSPHSVLSLPAGFESEVPETPQEISEEWHSLEETERRYVLKVLEKTGDRVEGPGGAAELLQLKPSTLRFRIKKLGIKRKNR